MAAATGTTTNGASGSGCFHLAVELAQRGKVVDPHKHLLMAFWSPMGQTQLAEPDAGGDEARTLRPLQAAAVTYRIAFGPRAGHRVLTLRGAMPRDWPPRQLLCADIDGFSLQAAVRCEARDRKRMEQLCRYITRPDLSDERMQCNPAGQVELKLKTPRRDCATYLVMSPQEFMQGLAALAPCSRPDTQRSLKGALYRGRLCGGQFEASSVWRGSSAADQLESVKDRLAPGCRRSTSLARRHHHGREAKVNGRFAAGFGSSPW